MKPNWENLRILLRTFEHRSSNEEQTKKFRTWLDQNASTDDERNRICVRLIRAQVKRAKIRRCWKMDADAIQLAQDFARIHTEKFRLRSPQILINLLHAPEIQNVLNEPFPTMSPWMVLVTR